VLTQLRLERLGFFSGCDGGLSVGLGFFGL
jgi:hypothetical protein